MITRGQLRPRGSHNALQARGTTPQPRQRLQVYQDDNLGNDFFQPKVEDLDELTGQEYFAEEAAREDDIMSSTTTQTMREITRRMMSLASTNYS
eukprot:6101234-Amphidinium_carterae.1